MVKNCKKNVPRSEQCICQDTQTLTTLNTAPRADMLTTATEVHHFIFIPRLMLLLVHKPSLAVVLCHTCYCVSFVLFSLALLCKKYFLTIVQSSQGIYFRVQICFPRHQSTFPVLSGSWRHFVQHLPCTGGNLTGTRVESAITDLPQSVDKITVAIATKNWKQSNQEFITLYGDMEQLLAVGIATDAISRPRVRCL